MPHSICRIAVLVMLLLHQADASTVIVGSDGVIYTDDLALVACGKQLSISSPASGETGLASTVGAVSARALDPAADALIALPAGDRSFGLPTSDPFLGASLEAVFRDEQVAGVGTVRRGAIRIYRTLPDSTEQTYLTATAPGMRLVDDYQNIEIDDAGAGTSAVELDTPTLAAHGSPHVASVISLCGGAVNPDISWMLVVSTTADTWALLASRVDASFDRLRDETTAGFVAGHVSAAAHVEILVEAASAEADFTDETAPASSAAAATVTLTDLEDRIEAYESSDAIDDAALAARLGEACKIVLEALALHANHPTPIVWGNPSF